MNATMTMPETGSTVRTQSRRRFVLVGESRIEPGSPWIVKRSDAKPTLQTERNKVRSRNIDSRFVIFDTVTGEWS